MHRLHVKFLAACEKTTDYESSSEAELAVGSLISSLQCFWKANHITGAELKVEEKVSISGNHIWQLFAPVQGRYKVQANLLVLFRLEELEEKFVPEFYERPKLTFIEEIDREGDR